MQSAIEQYWKGMFWLRRVSPFRSFAVYRQRGWQPTHLPACWTGHPPISTPSSHLPREPVSQMCQWCVSAVVLIRISAPTCCYCDTPLRLYLSLLYTRPFGGRRSVYCDSTASGKQRQHTHRTCLNALEDAAPTLCTGGLGPRHRTHRPAGSGIRR